MILWGYDAREIGDYYMDCRREILFQTAVLGVLGTKWPPEPAPRGEDAPAECVGLTDGTCTVCGLMLGLPCPIAR